CRQRQGADGEDRSRPERTAAEPPPDVLHRRPGGGERRIAGRAPRREALGHRAVGGPDSCPVRAVVGQPHQHAALRQAAGSPGSVGWTGRPRRALRGSARSHSRPGGGELPMNATPLLHSSPLLALAAFWLSDLWKSLASFVNGLHFESVGQSWLSVTLW